MKKNLLTSMVALGLLTACNGEDQNIINSNSSKYKAQVEELEWDKSFLDAVDSRGLTTRTVIDFTTFKTFWSQGDRVGVFPTTSSQFSDGTTSQLPFTVNGGEGTTFTLFDGGGFGLIEGAEYAASYPYQSGNDQLKAVNYDYTYMVNEATALVPSDFDFVNRYDYMKADPVVAPDDITHFHFERVGCVVLFDMTFYKPGVYDELKVSAIDDKGDLLPIVTYATGDMTQPNRKAERANELLSTKPTPGNTTDAMMFKIRKSANSSEGVAITEADFNNGKNYRQFIWMMFPQDFSNHQFIIAAHNATNDRWYSGLSDGLCMKSDVAYAYMFELKDIDETWMYLNDLFEYHNSESSIVLNQFWISTHE